MKVNFNVPLVGINGKEEVNGGTIAKALTELLGAERAKGEIVAKIYGWHKELLEKGELNLDNVDSKKLKELVQDSEGYVFFKGQVIELIDNAK